MGTMAKIDDSVKKKVPELRFAGFADDWEERKFKDIIEKLTGGASIKPSDYLEEGIRTIPKGAVNSTGLADLSGSKYISEEFYESNKSSHVSTNNLVTSLRDLVPSAPNMGRIVRIAGEDEDFLMPQGVYKLELFDGMDKEFLIAFSNSDKYRKIISSEKNGSTQVHIRNGEFLNIDIELPFSEEQKQIGSFFKQLDNSIALHQRKLDLLKEQKKGYLQKMFPKNGGKVPELRFAGFADDWEERKFKDILKTHSFRSYLAGVSENGEYEVIQQGDKPIVGYSDGEPFTDYKDVTLFGDHTVSLYKPKSPFFVATDGVKILSADNFEGNYLYTTLERYKPEPQGYKRHFTILKNQDVWFTENMEEQQKIGSFFKQLDDTIALHQRKLDLLKEQKKGFLQKMFV